VLKQHTIFFSAGTRQYYSLQSAISFRKVQQQEKKSIRNS